MDEAREPWMARYIRFGVRADDDDRRRLRKASLTLVVTVVCLLSPVWIATYLLLGRPAAALIPAAYVVLSIGGLAWMFVTKRDRAFVATQVGAMLLLPLALQWVLGGFVEGSAVALWSFAAVLVALVSWGTRAATVVFVGFVAGILVSGFAEADLRAAVQPLPQAVATAFFVLNVSAPLATAFALLVYFNRDREAALAVADALLDNILPAAVVRQLKAGRQRIADRHEDATVMFIDLVDFTGFADRTPPERVVELLDQGFSELDALGVRYGVEKIKTLGDGYLAAAGVTQPSADHARAVADMALEATSVIRQALANAWPEVDTRIGIATGPVIGGVIGERRLGFDVWGDTVNTASRMASHAQPGTIQVTAATASALSDGYVLAPRGEVQVKGKGPMATFVLSRSRQTDGADSGKQGPTST